MSDMLAAPPRNPIAGSACSPEHSTLRRQLVRSLSSVDWSAGTWADSTPILCSRSHLEQDENGRCGDSSADKLQSKTYEDDRWNESRTPASNQAVLVNHTHMNSAAKCGSVDMRQLKAAQVAANRRLGKRRTQNLTTTQSNVSKQSSDQVTLRNNQLSQKWSPTKEEVDRLNASLPAGHIISCISLQGQNTVHDFSGFIRVWVSLPGLGIRPIRVTCSGADTAVDVIPRILDQVPFLKRLFCGATHRFDLVEVGIGKSILATTRSAEGGACRFNDRVLGVADRPLCRLFGWTKQELRLAYCNCDPPAKWTSRNEPQTVCGLLLRLAQRSKTPRRRGTAPELFHRTESIQRVTPKRTKSLFSLKRSRKYAYNLMASKTQQRQS